MMSYPKAEQVVEVGAAQKRPVSAPHIELRNITKAFGPLVANDRVSLDVLPGQVHALLGENGAGKSTLMNVLYGLLEPDSGTILFDGEPVRFKDASAALGHGVGMVHQHFMLVPDLSVTQNVAIGARRGKGQYQLKRLEDEVRVTARRYGFDLEVRARVGDLSVEDRQHVEILKLLHRGARTLILDEPTAALSDLQVNALLRTIAGLRDAGHSVVIVTHKLDEVLAIADTATVMCQGRVVETFPRGEFDEDTLTRAMFAELAESASRPSPVSPNARIRLSVEGLAAKSSDGRERLKGLSLDVREGEIVGIAGVAGSGQTELVNVLAGLQPALRGAFRVDGEDVLGRETAQLRASGIAVIPEDRHAAGLVLEMTVAENLALAQPRRERSDRLGLLRRRAMRKRAQQLITEFDIRPPLPNQKALNLSGGNQQKVVVARELSSAPKVLVVASPTRGVDLRAAESIYERIEEAARGGCAVLLLSPDLDEIIRIAHRVVVMHEGQNVLALDAEQTTTEEISRAMVRGVQDRTGAKDV